MSARLPEGGKGKSFGIDWLSPDGKPWSSRIVIRPVAFDNCSLLFCLDNDANHPSFHLRLDHLAYSHVQTHRLPSSRLVSLSCLIFSRPERKADHFFFTLCVVRQARRCRQRKPCRLGRESTECTQGRFVSTHRLPRIDAYKRVALSGHSEGEAVQPAHLPPQSLIIPSLSTSLQCLPSSASPRRFLTNPFTAATPCPSLPISKSA